MPKIYSEEKRQELAEQLLEAGLDSIRRSGIKKLSIEELTKKVGIAQGTFYNFFPSKEMLIFFLAERYQTRVEDRMQAVIREKGFLERHDLKELYTCMMLEDNDNILRYLSRDDLQVLVTRLPKACLSKVADTRSIVERNLTFVPHKKDTVDVDAVINWIQLMQLAIQNKDLLIEDGLRKIMLTLIENMLEEIFERE
jgi:AcrR family transcriptional regulator